MKDKNDGMIKKNIGLKWSSGTINVTVVLYFTACAYITSEYCLMNQSCCKYSPSPL